MMLPSWGGVRALMKSHLIYSQCVSNPSVLLGTTHVHRGQKITLLELKKIAKQFRSGF